ncbi:hypothetical protein B296_00051227 [Ensete ventricosum]|uniref:Uncharacterized protein n=1 Tax=Ensete ventricosum TaxID=4639 RepID=A0A426YHU3_ENSVE|nr:hypothetical protein B296_00051227 [Ensete ventricosum]
MLQSSTSKPLFTTSGALASFLYSLSNDSFYNRLSATTLLFCWLSHSSVEVSLCMRPSSLCTTTVASAPMSSGTFPTPSTADDGFYIYSSTKFSLTVNPHQIYDCSDSLAALQIRRPLSSSSSLLAKGSSPSSSSLGEEKKYLLPPLLSNPLPVSKAA